jgi:hypothetical protein
MAQFSQLITTKQGQILIAKMLSGTNGIKFTRITTSSTRYEINQLEDLTELSDTKQSVLVSKVSRPSEITVQVEAAVRNDEIMTGYYLRSIGLYATDPDVGEVLFAVTIETSGNCYMPAYNGVAVSGAYIKLVARVSNSEIVNLEVDPAAVATVGDIMNKLDFDSDISETVIETLEPIDTKYPVPSAGESTKVFLGKVKKYIEDTKPLDSDMTVYVATTGSDTLGDGTSAKPYRTINFALSKIPKVLNGFTASIIVSTGTYNEDVTIYGYTGDLRLLLQGNITVSGGILVTHGELLCRSIDSTTYTLTTKWIAAVESGYFNSRLTVNVLTTGTYSIGGATVSLCSNLNSCLFISGVITITGNTDIGAYVVNSSRAHFGTLLGTGLNIGVFSAINSELSYDRNNIIATTRRYRADRGGVVVNPYGAVISTLQFDTTLYVATTGSDDSGDGTSARPYKTIQYVINSLPKDLGSHVAIIEITDGSYDERVVITGFYNGRIRLKSSKPTEISTVCSITDVSIVDNSCTVVEIRGINFTTTASNAVYGVVSGFVLVSWCRCVLNSTWSGFSFDQTRFEVSSCEVSNRGIALMSHGSDGNSLYWSGSSINNVVGLHAEYGGTIKKTSTQPQATALKERCHSAGSITNENGTQISGVISSGLSCTWGTISGGYVRHGNAAGAAMVTVMITITLSVSLSANTVYSVFGFPTTAISVSMCATPQWLTSNCGMSTDGIIRFTPNQNFTPSAGSSISVNCTYLTNS